MTYEWEVAWRYLHLTSIARFCLGVLVVAALWGCVYAAAALGAGHAAPLLPAPDWLLLRPGLVVRLVGLAISCLVLCSLVGRLRGVSGAASAAVGLLLLFGLQQGAISTNLIDDVAGFDVPLLVATGALAGTLLRPSLRVPFITVLTAVSMFGVALGVASIIVVLSVMNGFDKDFHRKILGVKSHVMLEKARGIQNWRDVTAVLQELPGTQSVQPVVDGLALIRANRLTRSVLVRGLDPRYEPPGSFFRRSVIVGSPDGIGSPRATGDEDDELVDITELETQTVPVLIGAELARFLWPIGRSLDADEEEERAELSRVLGQPIRIVAAELGDTAVAVPNTAMGEVAGVFATRFYDFDSNMIIVGIDTARYLYGLGDAVNRIEVRLLDEQPESTRQYAIRAHHTVADQLGTYEIFDTWMDVDRIFYESLVLERRMMAIILSIIVLVASCSILTTLVMVVMEKTRDIGVLRAIGATRRSIMALFVAQGMLIGLLGTAAGCVLAVILCYLIELLEISIPGGGSLYYIERLPVQMEPIYFTNIILYTIVLSFMATLYPAYRASHMPPVEAIRYE